MRPRRFHSANQVFQLEGGTEDNDLWVRVDSPTRDPGDPCGDLYAITSVWVPSDDERERLAAGENVEFTTWGTQTPVRIGVTPEPLGKPPDSG